MIARLRGSIPVNARVIEAIRAREHARWEHASRVAYGSVHFAVSRTSDPSDAYRRRQKPLGEGAFQRVPQHSE